MEYHGGSGDGGLERWDFDDAVDELRIEEAGFGANPCALPGEEAVIGLFVGRLIGDVVKHPAEVAVLLIEGQCAGGKRGVVFDQSEAGGKLAATEAGLVEALASAGTALEHVEVFAFAGFLREFWATLLEAVVENFEVCFDKIGDVAQEGGGALLAGVFDEDAEVGDGLAFHGSGTGSAGFDTDFVAPDVSEADGAEDVDAVDDPADLRFPVDGFENATGRRRSNDVVGDAFDFHFRAGKAGEFASEVEFNAVGHGEWLLLGIVC